MASGERLQALPSLKDNIMMKNIDQIATLYAETLLRVFHLKVGSKPIALKFNRDDVFEVLTGKSAGKMSEAYFDKLQQAEDSESGRIKHEIALQFLADMKKSNDAQQFLTKLMEAVSDALTGLDLCDEYGHELAIFEVESPEWMAIDLSTIESVDADF
jgi:hypothetical protein